MDHNFLTHSWDTQREIRQIPLAILPVKRPSLRKTDDWNSLPPEVAGFFDAGNILVTSPLGKRSRYSVLMAVTPTNEIRLSQGRSGVLLKDGLPIVVSINGKEFVVELKGCGNADGGFAYEDERLRGGVSPSASESEFNNLEAQRTGNVKFAAGKTVRALANIQFDSPQGRQGYILRLSPGSIRASYRFDDSFSFWKKPRWTRRMACAMGNEMGEKLAHGLVLLTHVENFIADNKGSEYYLTDFSDIRSLIQFPTEIEGVRLSLFHALLKSLQRAEEIPGFRKEDGMKDFISGLADALLTYGKISPTQAQMLHQCKEFDGIRDVLWESFLALDYYRAMKQEGWSYSLQKFPAKSPKSREDLVRGFMPWIKRQMKFYRQESSPELMLLQQAQNQPEKFIQMARSSAAMCSLANALKDFDRGRAGKYYLLWKFWEDFMLDQFALGKSLLEVENILVGAAKSSSSALKREIAILLTTMQERLAELRKMTPYDYGIELMNDPDFPKRMLAFPRTYITVLSHSKGGTGPRNFRNRTIPAA